MPHNPKWTPGPWSVEQQDWADGHGFWWQINCRPGDPPIVELADTAVPPIAWSHNSAGEIPPLENLANAHLIAAAPNLYAALADAIAQASGQPKSCGCPYNCIHTWGNAEAALAKARGEQPESPTEPRS